MSGFNAKKKGSAVSPSLVFLLTFNFDLHCLGLGGFWQGYCQHTVLIGCFDLFVLDVGWQVNLSAETTVASLDVVITFFFLLVIVLLLAADRQGITVY